MGKRLLTLLLALALCLGLGTAVYADTVDAVWNDDYSVLFTVTSGFHPEWQLFEGQYAVQTLTGYRGTAADLTLPAADADGAAIQAVNDNAFSGNTAIQSVVIPDSYVCLGWSAFAGCTGLSSVVLPDGMVRIGSSAFSNCSALTAIDLPASLTSVEQSTFFYCEKLTRVEIPDGVTSIGNSAFWGCSGLTSIAIPASVTTIDYGAFMGCTGLTDVYYGGTADQWKAIQINNNQNYNDALLNAAVHYGSDAPAEEPIVGTFGDVKQGAWYADSVAWAVEQGITNGTSSTAFSPRCHLHQRPDHHVPVACCRRSGACRRCRVHRRLCRCLLCRCCCLGR